MYFIWKKRDVRNKWNTHWSYSTNISLESSHTFSAYQIMWFWDESLRISFAVITTLIERNIIMYKYLVWYLHCMDKMQKHHFYFILVPLDLDKHLLTKCSTLPRLFNFPPFDGFSCELNCLRLNYHCEWQDDGSARRVARPTNPINARRGVKRP